MGFGNILVGVCVRALMLVCVCVFACVVLEKDFKTKKIVMEPNVRWW